MNTITITRTGDRFALCVDGGNIECSTTAEVMSRVGHEMGMPYLKANKDLFERFKKAEQEADELREQLRIADERVRIADVFAHVMEKSCKTLRLENRKLRSAIVGWFVRAYKEG